MIQSPVLIIGCPRSGTTLLFNVLSEARELWSIGYESKEIIEHYHHPSAKNWESGALEASDLTGESRGYMLREFERQAAPGSFWRRVNRMRGWLRGRNLYRQIKRRGKTEETGSSVSAAIPQRGLNAVRGMVVGYNTIFRRGSQKVRLLEKTPENCLRLPFLLGLFPDARVIYLTRDGRPNIHSLMEGWRQKRIFAGYQVPEKADGSRQITIPGDERGRWAFTLIPGWQELTGSPLEEVCAWQWVRCNEAVLAHRRLASEVPYLTIRYEEMVGTPQRIFREVADFVGIDYEENFGNYANGLPRINVVSEPDADKWRRVNGEAIGRVEGIIRPMMERLGYPLT
ncbi:MAG: sulfotransferase [Anaerolineales bacterium]|nr:sulfotransferase [Anaerolineales bacterium]